MTHGTRYAYNVRKCKCDECRAAGARYRARRYAAKREQILAAQRAAYKRRTWGIVPRDERRSA